MITTKPIAEMTLTELYEERDKHKANLLFDPPPRHYSLEEYEQIIRQITIASLAETF